MRSLWPRSTMRSVNSTAALRRSGYWNCGRSSSKSGHGSNGGRLSRVNVSTCAEQSSCGEYVFAEAMSVLNGRENGSRDNNFLDVGRDFIDPQCPDGV